MAISSGARRAGRSSSARAMVRARCITRSKATQPVYWTGPSIGFDAGANAANTFVLVYNLYDTEDLYKRFPAGEGQAYFVGGLQRQLSAARRCGADPDPGRCGAAARGQCRLHEVFQEAALAAFLNRFRANPVAMRGVVRAMAQRMMLDQLSPTGARCAARPDPSLRCRPARGQDRPWRRRLPHRGRRNPGVRRDQGGGTAAGR